MIENCQIRDFGEISLEISLELSLELNVIEETDFFLQKEGVNLIEMSHK